MASQSKSSAFSPSEHLILSSWFEGVDCDDNCDRPEVEKALDDRGYTESVGHVYTRHQAAVAGIALDRYQHRLLFQRGARRVVSRAIRRRRREGGGAPEDDRATIRHLFTIWSSAGPGTSWGNQFCLAWLPELGRFVVTDSTDDEEPYEYSDFAIGHFAPCDDENAAAMEVITAHWRRQREESLDDEAPTMEVQAGAISAGVVEKCLDEVWRVTEERDEQEVETEEPCDEYADCDAAEDDGNTADLSDKEARSR